MDGCRSKNAITSFVSTSSNDANDKDRKKGRSILKMGEAEVRSENAGRFKPRVCSEGARDKTCLRSLSLGSFRVSPGVRLKRIARLVMSFYPLFSLLWPHSSAIAH
jgi:hypothetical protein